MERKLATIRQATEILPIPEADRIVLAKVDGWHCVVNKTDFNEGDLGVYFEIDSFLPISDSRFAFLINEKRIWNEKEGVRLRTRKFKKQISQGLFLPLKDFPELKEYKLGDDVTDILKIEKWEPPLSSSGFSRQFGDRKRYRSYSFPHFIPKTDEERIQNLPNVFTDNKGWSFEVTEKLDGTSATFFYGGPDKEFGVCSRNVWIRKHQDFFILKFWRYLKKKFWNPTMETERMNSYWKLAKQYKLDYILPNLGKQYAFQGEIIGEGIQRNHYKIQGHEFYLFNVYDIELRKYLHPVSRQVLLDEIKLDFNVEIKHVQVYPPVELDKDFNDVDHILSYADGPSAVNKDVLREGVVFKREDGQAHFKAVSNKFLIKTGE